MEMQRKIGLMRGVIDHLRDLLDAGGHLCHIDMDTWGYVGDKGLNIEYLGKDKYETLDQQWKTPHCETVACFAGYAWMDAEIRKDVIRYGEERWGDGSDIGPNRISDWLADGYVLEDFTNKTPDGWTNSEGEYIEEKSYTGKDAVFERLFSSDLKHFQNDHEDPNSAEARGDLLNYLDESLDEMEKIADREGHG